MKYNLASLDYALDHLLPQIKEAKSRGVNFDRWRLIKMVAEDYLVKSVLDNTYNPSFKDRMCLYVVAEARNDLSVAGYFVPGIRILEEEV